MRRIASVLVVFLLLASTAGAGGFKKAVLKIEGLTCSLCAPAVKVALEGVPGVKRAEVIYERKEAVVEYEEGRVDPADLVRAVERTGFRATVEGDDGRKR